MGIAITLAQYLLDQEIPYDLVPHRRTETSLASAAASGLPADRLVKAVLLKGGSKFRLALLPASCQIQFRELRQLLGDDVDIASEEQAETLFPDCEPGSVPALGGAYGLDVVVDDSLDQQPDLYLDGGDHTHLVHVSRASFRKLMEGYRHGKFAGRPGPNRPNTN